MNFLRRFILRSRLVPVLGLVLLVALMPALAVMYNRDTGDTKSRELANLPPFSSRANIPGCTAVLIAPNVLLSASHCVNYAASGTVNATWNGQTLTGAAFTTIGADHVLIVTASDFTGTLGKMTAPYSGTAENNRLVWKVASGGNGVIGYGGTGPFYDGIFRAMTNRIEVNNVATPPNPVTTDYLYYDNDGPPSRPSRATTLYEGGTAPGDSGGPLYMFEGGRWYVIGVTSGPDAGYYRDGRVRTDLAQIESITGYTWARPVAPVLEMRWMAQDLVATVADGAAVSNWSRQGGTEAWTNNATLGATGTATLAHAATPNGTAAVDFPGTAKLALAAASNPVAGETSFTLSMVVRADAAGADVEGDWQLNTGLIDAQESTTTNDWGLAMASTGKAGLGLGRADATQYSSGSIQDGQWHVVVASWDGAEVTGDAVGLDRNMAVYVDSVTNVARRQGPEFLNVGRNAANVVLGGSKDTARFLDGRVAEVRLYRGALTDSAVESLIKELRHTHIAPQLDVALTRPATARAAIPVNQGAILDATITGTAPVVSITQTSGPATAQLSSTSALPACVTFPSTGVYQFNVTTTDGAASITRPVTLESLASGGTPTAGVPVSVGGAWTAQNIGDATTAGALTTGVSTATLTGSGMGFQEVSDSMRFVWKPLTGDGTITGRVVSFSANNGGKAYGGLMLRSSLRRESANVAATVISGGGVQFTRRDEDGSYTEPTPHTLKAPYWVRIRRVGNVFSSFRSEDGSTWTQQGTDTTITMPTTAMWGLAVTSHATNSVSEVRFTNVSLTPLGGQPASGNAWAGADIGSPVPAGSHTITSGNFDLDGGGTDIFGTSDAFYYLSQSFDGDAQLTARVFSQDRTDPWAKAGVMVRASTAADAANAFTAVTPLNGITFQTRLSAAASTGGNNSGTAGFTAPYWLRLTRAGDVFTCFRSTDGTNWFQLGPSETITGAPATMHAGFMIASVNNNGNSVIALDNLSLTETGATTVAPLLGLASTQNPNAANGFTLTATTDRSTTWSWQQVSGPGALSFRAQNTATPQTAFTQPGTYVVRAIGESIGAATFVEQSLALRLDARWNFTAGNEGWSTANPAGATAAGGLITATATSGDPQFQRLNAAYVSGDLARHLLVRYRGTTAATAQLFWGRIGATGFTGARSLSLGYSPANSWTALIFNPSVHADWAGDLIQDLRFDPAGSTGTTFDIDWVAFSDGDLDDDGLTDLAEGSIDTDGDGSPNLDDLDSDNDTLPDAWESLHDLSVTSAADATLDRDNDGQSNASEFIAGTNPSSQADVFKVTSATRSTSFALTVTGKTGRYYVLERSTQLVGGTWATVMTSPTLSSDATVLLTDPAPPAGKAFYRARVEMP